MSKDPAIPDPSPPRSRLEPPRAPLERESRRHKPAEARREQILTAALSCFGEKGYHASTMDDIVRASGLSKGSLYWHFSSKEEVFLELVDSFSDELYGEWDNVAESGDDKLDVLKRECEVSLRRFSEKRLFLLAWAEFVTHPAARERMRDSYSIAREQLEVIIRAGRANGSLARGPSEDGVASALVAALEGLFLQWLVDPEFDLEGHFAISWELLEKGLRP
jgi:AcrR family transcriptional regulator